MMDLTMESFNVRCCECGKRITIFKSDLDIEVSCYNHGDNCMGIEIIYEIQHEISCPKCGNILKLLLLAMNIQRVLTMMMRQPYLALSSSKGPPWEYVIRTNLILMNMLLKQQESAN